MNILLVEDNEYKANDIVCALITCSDGDFDITVTKSRNGALHELADAYEADAMYDLIILDMQLPLFENQPGKILPEGGLHILEEIKRCKYNTIVAFCSGEQVDCDDAIMCIKYDSSVYMVPIIEELIAKVKQQIKQGGN